MVDHRAPDQVGWHLGTALCADLLHRRDDPDWQPGSLAAVLVLRHVEPPAEHPEVSAVIDVNSQHVECS